MCCLSEKLRALKELRHMQKCARKDALLAGGFRGQDDVRPFEQGSSPISGLAHSKTIGLLPFLFLYTVIIKIISPAWWCRPVITAAKKAEAGGWQVQDLNFSNLDHVKIKSEQEDWGWWLEPLLCDTLGLT